jgi:hypothetical protein
MCQVGQASTQDSQACLTCRRRVRYVYLRPARRLGSRLWKCWEKNLEVYQQYDTFYFLYYD